MSVKENLPRERKRERDKEKFDEQQEGYLYV